MDLPLKALSFSLCLIVTLYLIRRKTILVFAVPWIIIAFTARIAPSPDYDADLGWILIPVLLSWSSFFLITNRLCKRIDGQSDVCSGSPLAIVLTSRARRTLLFLLILAFSLFASGLEPSLVPGRPFETSTTTSTLGQIVIESLLYYHCSLITHYKLLDPSGRPLRPLSLITFLFPLFIVVIAVSFLTGSRGIFVSPFLLSLSYELLVSTHSPLLRALRALLSFRINPSIVIFLVSSLIVSCIFIFFTLTRSLTLDSLSDTFGPLGNGFALVKEAACLHFSFMGNLPIPEYNSLAFIWIFIPSAIWLDKPDAHTGFFVGNSVFGTGTGVYGTGRGIPVSYASQLALSLGTEWYIVGLIVISSILIFASHKFLNAQRFYIFPVAIFAISAIGSDLAPSFLGLIIMLLSYRFFSISCFGLVKTYS
jgi:hypothetical protein